MAAIASSAASVEAASHHEAFDTLVSPESMITGGVPPPPPAQQQQRDNLPSESLLNSPLLPMSALTRFAAAPVAVEGGSGVEHMGQMTESAADVSLGALVASGHPPLAGISAADSPNRLLGAGGGKPLDVSADDIAHAFTPLRHYRAAGSSSSTADSLSMSAILRHSARPREPTPDEVASAITVLRAPALQSLPAEEREEIRRRIAEVKRRRRLSREAAAQRRHDEEDDELAQRQPPQQQ